MTDETPSVSELKPPTLRRTRRKLAFRVLALLLVWGVIEAASALIIPTLVHYTLLWESQKVIAVTGAPRSNEFEVVHPYVGWVQNRDIRSDVEAFGRTMPINSLGFIDSSESVYTRSDDKLIVGIVGGSVAWQLSIQGEEILKQRLAEIPQFANRDVIVVRLAQSGYKQPQGLMTLNYIYALGGEFDVVINLDGYNEIALPIAENLEADVALVYPRMWHGRMVEMTDPRDSAVSFRLLQVRAARQAAAQFQLDSVVGKLPSSQLIWYLRDKSFQRQIVELQAELLSRNNARGRTFADGGPRPDFANRDESFAEEVAIWERCSLQMFHLCAANGTLYVHAIQPNQYVTDSKPLSEKELEACYWPDNASAVAVRDGYPRLSDGGDRLARQGIHLFDLTRIFEDHPETLYVDPWCHVNEAGNELLTNALMDRVVDVLKAETVEN
ncbi:MAG: hypothetical protein KDA66_10905 [Planctomycetaceae bacterium]|nr:hypothetical protein [Planctomycetaceae bacterium]